MEKKKSTTASKIEHLVITRLWKIKDLFVNVYFIQNQHDNSWVLVDAGLKTAEPKIKGLAKHLFGPDSRPVAIVLTHAHFDHVGSLKTLADEWQVPIYAHPMERPYLNGSSDYPPPDPSVGGGLMAKMAFMYPRGPIDVRDHLVLLPPDGSIPCLPEWRYIHTPGHAPGHISLFRDSDRVLVAGDAFVTTQQESALSVMFQKKKLSGPPKYFTYDWAAAANSVAKLAALQPEVAATGHGIPMRGGELRKALTHLLQHFQEEAVPEQGRYVGHPAVVDESGVVSIPSAS